MKTKPMLLLGVAAGCGLVAMLGVQQILAGKDKRVDTVPVLVARQEIPAGLKLDASMVAFEERPKETVPEGVVTEASQYEDRSLKYRAFPGDFILQAKLGAKGEHGISSTIPLGMRLFTVPVDMTTVHSGMVRPGDRVDVMVTYKVKRLGAPETPRSKTILKFIEVFALDRIREGEGGESNKGAKIENLSLLVTPEQAHVLALAKDLGKLQLALRSPQDKPANDENSSGIDETMFDELVATTGLERPAEPVAAKPAPEPAPAFQNFLKGLAGNAGKTAERPELPKPEGWIIRIWENDKVSEEVVGQYLKPKSEAAADQAAPPSTAAPERAAESDKPEAESRDLGG